MYTNNFYINIINDSININDLSYRIDPIFSLANQNNDENILPLEVQSLYKHKFDSLLNLDPLVPNFITFYNGSQYLTDRLFFNDIYLKDYKNLITSMNCENYIVIDNHTKIKYKQITLHKFPSLFNVLTYTIFKKTNLFNDSVLMICKSTPMHRSLVYYKKYTLYQEPKKINNDIKIYLQIDNIRKIYLDRIFKYYENTNCVTLPSIITNNYIDELQDIKYTTIIIDSPLLINDTYLLVGNNSSFQLLISHINLALKFLKKKGNLMINYYSIPNRLVLNFIIYLSKMFEKFYFPNIDELVNMKDTEIIIFENFNPSDKMIKEIYDFNALLQKNDSSNGFDYRISNDIELYDYNLKKEVIPNYKYLTNLIVFNDEKIIHKIYKNYKKYIIHKFEQRINVIDKAIELYEKRNNVNDIEFALNINRLKAIDYAKKYNINIVEWVDSKKVEEYFNLSLFQYYDNLELYKLFKLNKKNNNIKLKISDNIDSELVNSFNTWSILSENAYEITEKVNKDKFKEIELFFNNRQKDLNKYLYKECKVNINGRITSRAWIKMQELLTVTKFFKNIIRQNKNNNINTVNAFHICEAPGNFINSCNYYLNSHTDMKYNWKAQSLFDSNIFDQYGFIKNNPDRWDFYDGGDVTKYSNFIYYYNKYKNSDVLISDCGTEWIANNDGFQKPLPVYELLYSILLPRVGGNFIMKTIASSYNKQFVSLVYLATIKFKKVYIFKSNNNFWSQEIYIVGKNKSKFTDDEEKILFDMLKELENKKIVYPVQNINDDFCNDYNAIMQDILDQFKITKKFFTFLIDYEELFEENNKKLSNASYKKNVKWLKHFMNHIPNANEKYRQSRHVKMN